LLSSFIIEESTELISFLLDLSFFSFFWFAYSSTSIQFKFWLDISGLNREESILLELQVLIELFWAFLRLPEL
jgi:hypothetical protein